VAGRRDRARGAAGGIPDMVGEPAGHTVTLAYFLNFLVPGRDPLVSGVVGDAHKCHHNLLAP